MLQTLNEIQSTLTDNQERLITPAMLRNFAESVIGVKGTMYATGVVMPVTASWAVMSAFTNSIDTKGLTPQLPQGRFLVEAGAGGVYSVAALLCLDSTVNGELSIALVKNGALTPYQVTYSVNSGQKIPFVLQGSGTVADGDTIGLAVKGSGTANVSLVHGSLILDR